MKTSTTMIEWQYKSVLKELQLLQDHASSPDCPCALSDLGEYCLPKHALSIAGYAEETAVMDSANAKLWYELQESATEVHENLKKGVCGKGKDEDVAGWSREWRKRIERIYYSCKVQPKAHLKSQAEQVHLENPISKVPLVMFKNLKVCEKYGLGLGRCYFVFPATGRTSEGRIGICADPKFGLPRYVPCEDLVPVGGKDACRIRSFGRAIPRRKVVMKQTEKGFVICTDGKKLATGPVAEGTADRVSVPTACPSQMKPLAVYHTHTEGEPVPSQQDIEEVAKMKIPMVCVEAKGQAKCYGVPKEGAEMKGNPRKIDPDLERVAYYHCTGKENPKWLECQRALDHLITDITMGKQGNPVAVKEARSYLVRFRRAPTAIEKDARGGGPIDEIMTIRATTKVDALKTAKNLATQYGWYFMDLQLSEDNPITGGAEMSKKPSCKLVKDYYHCRIKPKGHFDPQSFRTVSPKEGVRITIGCPKGKFDKEKQVCKVGTESQKILYRKDVYK